MMNLGSGMVFMCRLVAGVFLFGGIAAAQTQLKEGTGSIAGRVTLGGKPAPGVILTLRESSSDERRALSLLMKGSPSTRATTDAEGRYRFSGLIQGVYEVSAFAPALFSTDDKSTSVTLAEGATEDDIDFPLLKGGVITGRVTTKDGRPLIMEPVQALRLDQPDAPGFKGLPGLSFTTDDRGIYRIYGLPPGRYRVSVGNTNSVYDAIGQGLKRPAHPQTFHPGVTDQAGATIVDLSAGGEASNIDIKLGEANKTYRASGRIVDADTNKPIPNAVPSYRVIKVEGAELGTSGMGSPTSSTGEFRLEGLPPGQYVAFAFFGLDGASEFYTDQLTFEIKHDDLSGLLIKVHRGVSISGIAVVEGTTNPAVLERLGQVELFATVADSGAPNFARSRISGDGSFQLSGLSPGRARIMLQDTTGLRISRVERSGVTQPQGVELAPGDRLTDVRIIIVFAGGSIRGQVNVEGGQLPKGARLSVTVRRNAEPDSDDHDSESAEVDPAGRFVIEELIPGEYEVMLTAVLNPAAPASARQIRVARERVIVLGDSPTETVLVLDLGKTSERDYE